MVCIDLYCAETRTLPRTAIVTQRHIPPQFNIGGALREFLLKNCAFHTDSHRRRIF
jgi:hypothetical protein